MAKPAGLVKFGFKYSTEFNDWRLFNAWEIFEGYTPASLILYENSGEFLRFRGPWLLSDFYCSLQLGLKTAYDAKKFTDDCVELEYFRKENNHYIPANGLMEVLEECNRHYDIPPLPADYEGPDDDLEFPWSKDDEDIGPEPDYSRMIDGNTYITKIFRNNPEKFLKNPGPWQLSDLYHNIGFHSLYAARQFADECFESGHFKRDEKYYIPADGLMEVLENIHGIKR